MTIEPTKAIIDPFSTSNSILSTDFNDIDIISQYLDINTDLRPGSNLNIYNINNAVQ